MKKVGRVCKDKFSAELMDIRRYVSSYFSIDIGSDTRTREFVNSRTLYICIAKATTNASRMEIGRHINRDHSSITFAVNNLCDNLMLNKKYLDIYNTYVNIKLIDGIKKGSQLNNLGDFVEALEEINRLKEIVSVLKDNISFTDVIKEVSIDELTDNEKAYRALNSEDKRVYDERSNMVLKSFKWKRKDDSRKEVFETINIS
jgi:hypothetical protein